MGSLVDKAVDVVSKPFKMLRDAVIPDSSGMMAQLSRQQAAAQEKLERQQQVETRRRAESASEIAKRTARAMGGGGRSLLIKTSPRGTMATKLGG